MRASLCAILSAAVLLSSQGVASADPWKDESGHGYRGGGAYGPPPYKYFIPKRREYKYEYKGKYKNEYKDEYHYGNCKIERKWKSDGGYKEEAKCD